MKLMFCLPEKASLCMLKVSKRWAALHATAWPFKVCVNQYEESKKEPLEREPNSIGQWSCA